MSQGFDVLFEPGKVFADGRVEPRAAGTLELASGRIVVGDPSLSGKPLARTVAPGRYAVDLSVATVGSGQTRVAAARVRFGDGVVARWEPALPEGEDAATLEPGEFFGYGIDGGIAAFWDATAAVSFQRYERDICAALEAPGSDPHCGAVPLGDLVAFTSGAGDGYYASFWGLDGAGVALCLVTEFRIVGMDETRGAEILAAAWPGTPPPPGDLRPLFEVGRDLGDGVVLRVDDIGRIDVAGHVLVGPARSALLLARSVPAGEYALRVSVAKDADGDECVAALLLVLSQAEIASWEVAVPRGVDIGALPAHANPGLGFHCGDREPLFIGDDGARSQLAHAPKKIAAEVGAGTQTRWVCRLVDVGTHRVAGLAAGLRGSYAFWGLDAAGAPVWLVVPTLHVGQDATRPFAIIEASKQRGARS